jgi:hypothetical protein
VGYRATPVRQIAAPWNLARDRIPDGFNGIVADFNEAILSELLLAIQFQDFSNKGVCITRHTGFDGYARNASYAFGKRWGSKRFSGTFLCPLDRD